MSGDLYYFYESDLDRTNLQDFYNGLPSHLQGKFKASLNVSKISKGDVLQGYRGPSNMCNGGSGDSGTLNESHGLQEIKYWWGARKDMNYVPLVGNSWYALERSWQKILGELEWSSLYFDSRTGECLSHDRDVALEKLRKSKANARAAASSSNCRSVDTRESEASSSSMSDSYVYESNNQNREYQSQYRDDHQSSSSWREQQSREMRVQELYNEGDYLFRLGRYKEAEEIFRAAMFVSEIHVPCGLLYNRMISARDEALAKDYNSRGDDFFESGDYQKAEDEYLKAYNVSREEKERQKYGENYEKAKIERQAKTLNSQGYDLFENVQYDEAYDMYNRAYEKSRESEVRLIYAGNRNRAKLEADAVKINEQGNCSFKRGEYVKALEYYQQAHDKSRLTKEKNKYLRNRNKVRDVMERLVRLDTLWKEAWDAENDEVNDRSEEARDKFGKLASDSEDCLRLFPVVSGFKQYRTLVSLKIEGNEIFNRGLQSQQHAIALYRVAQQLNEQRNYTLAKVKFEEAMEFFRETLEKFEEGRKTDERFASCIEFIQEHMNKVVESIELIERCILNTSLQQLDVSVGKSKNCDYAHLGQNDGKKSCVNYSQHI